MQCSANGSGATLSGVKPCRMELPYLTLGGPNCPVPKQPHEALKTTKSLERSANVKGATLVAVKPCRMELPYLTLGGPNCPVPKQAHEALKTTKS
jgi:hypothetical protein